MPDADKRETRRRLDSLPASFRGWPKASTLRKGAPADAESRRLVARREGGAPAERAATRERGGRMEGAGEERLCTKDEREGSGGSNN